MGTLQSRQVGFKNPGKNEPLWQNAELARNRLLLPKVGHTVSLLAPSSRLGRISTDQYHLVLSQSGWECSERPIKRPSRTLVILDDLVLQITLHRRTLEVGKV